MATYIPQYDGYQADNPNIDFERCDGRVFSYDEVNTAGFTQTNNSITINGGQSNFPLAFIETDKAIEFTFTSSLFTMDMFEMANATTLEEQDVGTRETKRFEVEDGLTVTLPFEVQEGSIDIKGVEAGEAAAEGVYAVEITAATEEADGKTVITFNAADATAGDVKRISYVRRVVNAARVVVKTNTTSSKGALYSHWPLYSSGTDCTEANIKAWIHMYIPRVRVTAAPGFDSSYKTAQTPGVTFSAIDPKRADGKMYEVVYEPLDVNGNIVAKSSGEVAWN